MGILTRFIRGIDTVNRWVGHMAGWVSLAMVLVVVADVVMRYAFDTSFVFVQELEWHLFGVMFLLGAGYTLLQDSHVRVDVLYQRFSPKTQAWINLIGVLLFLLPGCLMVLDTSWAFFSHSLAMNEGSPDPGGIPARYILKSFIPLGFALLTLQGVSMGLKSLLEICGRPYTEGQEVAS
ncbi:MAG: TRAP transporter small permease subunit [Deferrisomatales bacterium]|nr:TRAP transporter small permease subunit [Deferrisomatales bacterium]